MAALNICNCALRIKDQLGDAYSTIELVFEPRRSQVHPADAVYISRPQRSKAVPGIVIQDLLYTVLPANLDVTPSVLPVTVAYTGGGTAGAEVVTVVGSAISVQIQSGVSTATQVRTAVLASVAASALVDCVVSGTAATAQTTVAATTLSDEFCLLKLAETTTDAQDGIFTLNWVDNGNFNSIVFDPVQVPNQSYQDLSSLLTTSRG